MAELKKLTMEPRLLKIPGLIKEIDRPWELDDYVEWLDEELRNGSTEERKHYILGHSNGGRIATAYAAKYPDKVDKLILIDSAGVRDLSWRAKGKRAVFKWLAKGGKLFTRHPLAEKFIYKLAGEKDYYQANPVMKQTMANLIEVDLREKMKLIKCPTLIIWGENDKMTPIKKAEITQRHIAGSKLKVIPREGHSPHYTSAAKVAKLVSKFL